MADNSVGYSRAGDAFHYRWAARRSLRLIYPNSKLFKITVEGTDDKNKAGELVIDLAEYYGEEASPTRIIYYQLKHTTTQKNKPFLISGLKETFEGFAEKFLELHKNKKIEQLGIEFAIITNRPFDEKFKVNLAAISDGTCNDKRFLKVLSTYTKLDSDALRLFCSILKVEDAHHDYDLQEKELRVEMMQLMAGDVDNNQLRSLSSAIAEKVLPNSDGILTRENVLNSFGIFTDLALYPAEPIWDPSGPLIKRQQYENLTDKIFGSTRPILIHAPGGVGKSIFTRQLLDNIQEGSVAVAYDCFGAGKYRNRSHSRHRHKEALVQIANELATKGLCDPLIVRREDDETAITRTFLKKLQKAINTIKSAYPDGLLVILIDAADNAEMAADEMADNCFASELLQEDVPVGCKLVYLCRPERIHLLKPSSKILQLELTPFTTGETRENLRIRFPSVTEEEAEEFHRLTSGNPRVQANAFDTGSSTIEELLIGFGPFVQTVEAQIQQQLENALDKVKGTLTTGFQKQIDRICMGLARLSPHIPLDILARSAGVEVSTVKSFVSEIGRSLWLSDESVQFRDEPTETWFREKFSAEKKDFENYILVLEPLADQSSYAAQMLPQLYLQAGQYEKLIDIALSDNFLPDRNPVDARNIRVFRLQFALQAALKIGQIKDACMLALRAGEEVAGNERQTALLKQNIDLLVCLQDKEKVQGMAMKRELHGSWEGSENVFSASLLSSIREFQGEARGFLRSADNWLDIYFKTPKETDHHQQEALQDTDLMEIAYSKLNLEGIESCMKFLTRLSPKIVIAQIFASLIRRLIDLEDFASIDQLMLKCKTEPLFIIESNSELFEVGRFANKALIEALLKKIASKKVKINKPLEHTRDKPKDSTIALLETAIYYNIPRKQISDFLVENLDAKVSQLFTLSHFTRERDFFLKTIALQIYVDGKDETDIAGLLNLKAENKKLTYDEQRKINDAKEVLGGLLPWYVARIELIANGGVIDAARFTELAGQSKKATSGRYQINDPVLSTLPLVLLDILKFASSSTNQIVATFFADYIKSNRHITIGQWISTVRWSQRLDHLTFLRDDLEQKAYSQIKADTDSGPDVLSNYYVSLSRAVINGSADNAVVYFEDAIDIISKVGDEMLRRWDAVVPLAKRTAELKQNRPDLSYRFLRIAELIGKDSRDKHWDREEALQVATRISPVDGIASLSRWREREFGPFGQMLYCLLRELVDSAGVNALEAWSFTEFCSGENLQYALRLFLKSNKISKNDKVIITEDGIRRLRTEIVSKNYWTELQELLDGQNLKSLLLTNILSQIPNNVIAKGSESYPKESYFMPEIDWADVFQGKDLFNSDGIDAAHEVLLKIAAGKNIHLGRHVFPLAVMERLKDAELVTFLQSFIQCSWVEVYDISAFFEQLPERKTARPAFKKRLESIVENVGSRFALDLTSRYCFDSMIKAIPGPIEKTKWLLQGIFAGLMTTQEFATAENLFGLVQLAAPGLTPEEASLTLDYGLARFEQHIEDDFGDGPWLPWLESDHSLTTALGKFLISALASPVSKTRWRAIHVLKKLAKYNRSELFGEVCKCVSGKQGGAFGSLRYPFYDLHALQYFLIACARISYEFPAILKSFADFFLKYALHFEHAIIQRFAADTIIQLESAFPETYSQSDLEEVKKVIKPDILVVEQAVQTCEVPADIDYDPAGYEEYEDELSDDETALDFHFGYDFSSYWLGPLGEVFGMSQKEIVDLAAGVVVNEWGRHEDTYTDDPRLELWNSNQGYYRTAHDHFSYPKDDNLLFYLSYHALMIIAARLIKTVPLNISDFDNENPWTEWLECHLNTREDGFLIADWKDPLPIIRPDYASMDFGDWQTGLAQEDFLKCLTLNIDGDAYVNVSGAWHEIIDYKSEKYYISSALVSRGTANSLVRALETCRNPHNFKLPYYEENNMEIKRPPFELTGWIVENHLSSKLDKNDPFASELPLPPYEIGETFVNKLSLKRSSDGKIYYRLENKPEQVMLSQLWASAPESRDVEAEQRGMRMSAKLDFLQNVCNDLNKEIIFEVQIQRNYYSKHSSRRDEDYKKPVHKIFILSADGKLTDTEGNYRIG